MRWLYRFGFGGPRAEESVALEIEHHLAEHSDRLVEEGWAPEDARREAERRFGDRSRHERRMRRTEHGRVAADRWSAGLDLLRGSVVSVVRMCRREPAFAAAIIITLALGIGANATMYGIMDRLLLHGPEHVVEPDQVVRVLVENSGVTPGRSVTPFIGYPDYLDLRAHRGLSALAAYVPWGPLIVGSGDSAAPAWVEGAGVDYFALLGVRPLMGRFFTPDEARAGSNPTAVIGFEYWRTAYAGNPNAIGRAIEVEGRVYTIIGVAPSDFTGVELWRVDVWLPLEVVYALESTDDVGCLAMRTCVGFHAVARLGSDHLLDAAEAEATRLHLEGRREMIAAGRYSDRARIVLGPMIAAWGPEPSGESRVARWLSGVSLIVLVIACANVANLLMARGTRRRREVGVRLALGAGRRVVVAQSIVESLLLAVAGGVLALFIARWGGEVVRAALLPDLYFPGSALTHRTVWFTLIAAAVAGLFAGVLPAVQGTNRGIAVGLYRDGLGASPRHSTLRGVLTVAQAAMTAALLVGAGLFLRSLNELRSLDLGLDVDRLAMVFPEFRSQAISPARQTELVLEAAERAAALPSVESAAATHSGFGASFAMPVRPRGFDSIPRLNGRGPYVYWVSPGYFETVGLVVTRGRGIQGWDVDGERIAVVSETMARTFWPEGDPIGECLLRPGNDECAFQVIGVVEDAARTGYRDEAFMAYYVPAARDSIGLGAIYVRASGTADDIVDELAEALRSHIPEVRYVRVQTVRERLDPQARSWTLGATMFTVFGLLALTVAAIGLYSVLAFDVAQRTRELGIRTALGARKARLLGSVVSRGSRLGALGIGLGLGAAYIVAPYAQDLLFQVQPRDTGVFSGVAFVLVLVSVAASLAPGLRATRVDPVTALKSD